MTFQEKLENYADITVSYGLNIQKGQLLFIMTEPIHRNFAALVAKKAYKKGARYVDVSFSAYMESDPVITDVRLRHSSENDIAFLPPYIKARYDELVQRRGAMLSIRGSEFPELFYGADAGHISMMQRQVKQSRHSLYEKGIGEAAMHWCIVAAATPQWAKQIYPHMSSEEAEMRLWDDIFSITRASHSDGVNRLWKLDAELKRRVNILNEMKIDRFHYQGPGTDLEIGLSPLSIFTGGAQISKRNATFQPNIPSEEIFTSPDRKKANGYVRATKPVMVNNQLVEGLEMVFKNGVLVSFSATKGDSIFQSLIDTDKGARRINELAIVGIDSPVFQSGIVFKETLFDEQAACHIALGNGFAFCFTGYDSMAPEELKAAGLNASLIHQDIMISDEHTDVFAITHSDRAVQVIRKGEFIL